MCMLPKLEEFTSKMIRKSPPGKWLERNYGIRPSGPLQMLGLAKKEHNLFYQPGGAGYAEDPAPSRPQTTHHINTIGAAKAKLEQQRGGQ